MKTEWSVLFYGQMTEFEIQEYLNKMEKDGWDVYTIIPFNIFHSRRVEI